MPPGLLPADGRVVANTGQLQNHPHPLARWGPLPGARHRPEAVAVFSVLSNGDVWPAGTKTAFVSLSLSRCAASFSGNSVTCDMAVTECRGGHEDSAVSPKPAVKETSNTQNKAALPSGVFHLGKCCFFIVHVHMQCLLFL